MAEAREKKKRFERFFLDKMVDQLGWTPRRIDEGSEPPDFFLDLERGRCAVEITQILHGDNAKRGSPERAQEEADEVFLRELHDAYLSGPTPQTIQVRATLPIVIRSPALRKVSPAERRMHLDDIKREALARLQELPALAPWDEERIKVEHRRGAATFHVYCLPPGTDAARRWDVINNHIGWSAPVREEVLQSKVAVKAADLAKYRTAVDSAVLLVVADRGRASGFFELDPNLVVDPLGFDAVYFQDDNTRLV